MNANVTVDDLKIELQERQEEIKELSVQNRDLVAQREGLHRELQIATEQLEGDESAALEDLREKLAEQEEKLEELREELASEKQGRAEDRQELTSIIDTREAVAKRYLRLAAEGRAPAWCDVCNTLRGHTPDCLLRAVAG